MSMVIRDIKDHKLNIDLNKDEIITIFIDDDINIEYKLNNGIYKILVFNNANKNISLKENGEIKK